MPVTLTGLKNKTGTVVLFAEDGDDNALHIEYYLVIEGQTVDGKLAEEKQLRGASSQKQLLYRLKQFCQLVKSWDLLGEDKQPIPLTPEALRAQVPLPFIYAILDAIAEDRDPNFGRSNGSSPNHS